MNASVIKIQLHKTYMYCMQLWDACILSISILSLLHCISEKVFFYFFLDRVTRREFTQEVSSKQTEFIKTKVHTNGQCGNEYQSCRQRVLWKGCKTGPKEQDVRWARVSTWARFYSLEGRVQITWWPSHFCQSPAEVGQNKVICRTSTSYICKTLLMHWCFSINILQILHTIYHSQGAFSAQRALLLLYFH